MRPAKKITKRPQSAGSPEELVRLLQTLNARLKAGLIDTGTPEFYAVMACAVQLGMHRLSEHLDQGSIDIHGGRFQDFLVALAKLRPSRRAPSTARGFKTESGKRPDR
jgi:hypothetical protein